MEKELIIEYLKEGNSIRKTSVLMGVSYGTLQYWISKLNISYKDYETSSTTTIHCGSCGTEDLNKFFKSDVESGKYSLVCRSCNASNVKNRFQKYKTEAVEYKGGECVICGYNYCIAALDFHHTNPLTKEFDWKSLKSKPIEVIENELDKCILVCKNCHAEIHYLDLRDYVE